MRTQKEIINCISQRVGTGKIQSVKSHEVFDSKYVEQFQLNLDMVPNQLIRGAGDGEDGEEAEAPADEEEEEGAAKNFKVS